MKDKYVVRMSAGLANRMLQYSYYLYLLKMGKEAYVDNNYRATKWKMEDIEWEKIFPHAIINQAPASLIFKYGGGYNMLDKLRRRYLHFTTKVWSMRNATDTPSDSDLKHYRYIIGVMQDSRIVEFVEKEVKDCFRFTEFEPYSKNATLAAMMKVGNSVSIHVRKGEDYMKNEAFKNVCTIDYYKKAISITNEKVENPIYFVFTDNPQWVKDNMKWFSYTLVENNPSIGWGNHYDMQLMSYCKHNIIANSTYSWWGAFLNQNPDKIVIDPQFWFNPEMPEFKDVENKTACKKWVII